MMVVKEPRINLTLAQRGLYRRQIHSTIVLDCPAAFPEQRRHRPRFDPGRLPHRNEGSRASSRSPTVRALSPKTRITLLRLVSPEAI